MKFIDMPSPNYWQDRRPIQAICLHGTAGSAAASLAWLRNPKSAVSSNYLISRAGEVYQLVDPRAGRKAWANGVVEKPDTSIKWLQAAIKAKTKINLITWSIEHEASSDEMRWHKSMTDKQFTSSIDLTAYLLKLALLKANHETIVGHCQISSIQKATCPGVIFVPAYLEELLKRYPELK